jgi:hypothetical protein
LALLLPITAGARCPDARLPAQKAVWLVQEGEAFRAAGTLLDAIHDETDPVARAGYRVCLVQVYAAAGQWQKASEAWQRWGTTVGMAQDRARQAEWPGYMLGQVLLALRAGAVQDVAHSIETLPGEPGKPWLKPWLAAMAYVQAKDWPAARVHVAAALDRCGTVANPQGNCRPADAARLQRLALVLEATPDSWSPPLAAGLSAVVPGSGFVYAGHGFDALLHGGATLLLGWLTWDTRTRGTGLMDQRPGTWVLGSLTGLFYTANVIASWDAAQRRTEVEAWRRAHDATIGAWPELPELPDLPAVTSATATP